MGGALEGPYVGRAGGGIQPKTTESGPPAPGNPARALASDAASGLDSAFRQAVPLGAAPPNSLEPAG